VEPSSRVASSSIIIVIRLGYFAIMAFRWSYCGSMRKEPISSASSSDGLAIAKLQRHLRKRLMRLTLVRLDGLINHAAL
jgi:hypothetical protein